MDAHMIMGFIRRIGRRVSTGLQAVGAVEGYDRWAATYDAQPENVVFALESPLFTKLLERVSIEGKIVVDVGCGTGRHWQEMLSRNPSELIGVDPSRKMLERLKAHYPQAQTICNDAAAYLPEIADASAALIVSTLALAHVPAAARALGEWSRILRAGGAMLITDFHPAAIRAGMKRTFVSEGQTIEIEHYPTDLEELRRVAADSGLIHMFTAERAIDESVRPLFERAEYLQAYEKYKGRPLVFGMHFIKPR